MKIIHKIEDFVFELFPNAKENEEKLQEEIKRYYTYGAYEPTVVINDGWIEITIDAERIEKDERKFQQLISLCENGQLDKAKVLAADLIEGAPNISEYHRILGQVQSDLGDQDEAINSLIDALRWNPKNEYALLMMGNIFARHKNDIDTAMKYYDQVLKIKPDDNIALNNIGANLMQMGNEEEAVKYFQKAIDVNPDYPNTRHALAMLAESRKDYKEAFESALSAIEKNPKKDPLYGESFKLAVSSAEKLCNEIDGQSIVQQFVESLQSKTGKEIKIEEDASIPTAAKIEIAENYNRDYHFVKYKPNYPNVEHLIVHELTHLELAEEAREVNKNELFVSNDSYKSSFIKAHEKDIQKMKKKGFTEESIAKVFSSLFEGLNRQAFNTPIDLFIEDRIYNRYEDLRPFQFLSMLQMLKEGIDANTREEIRKNTPEDILSNSIVYNLVNAIHFKNLYKIDLIADHKPTSSELRRAQKFYTEFEKYRFKKEPGEEYDLVQFWGEDLHIDRYFELVAESEYRKTTAESVLDDIEQNPMKIGEDDPSKERKMKMFLEEHSDADTNMAVAMYMVDSLNYFDNMPQTEIKKIAFEIATLGMNGIHPQKDGYHIPSIKGSSFSGYKTLAYYYVSFALTIPEMLKELQLPFDNEYELAKQMHKMG